MKPELARAHITEQATGAAWGMAQSAGAFHLGLLEAGVERSDALELTKAWVAAVYGRRAP